MKKRWRENKQGFTIVELLIVVVVIAILAGISVVAFSGIQARSQDSVTKQGANQFAKAIMNWKTLTGRTSPSGGWGSTQPLDSDGLCPDGSGSGWAATGYACNLEQQLVHLSLLPPNFTRSLPSNARMGSSNGSYTLMIYPCVTADSTWVLLYYLGSPSPEDIANYDDLNTQCPSGGLVHKKTAYGMQGGIFISFK